MPTEDSVEIFSWTDMFRALWYFLKGRRAQAVGWQALITTVYIIEVFVPPYAIARLSQLLLGLRPGDPTKAFFIYAILFGSLLSILGVSRNLSRLRMRKISIELGYEARVEGFERLMDFSYAWHQEESSGVRVQRITTGVSDLRQLWNKLYLSGINLVASLVGSFALFTLVNWSVGVFFAVYVGSIFSIERLFNKRFYQVSDQENAASEKTSGTYFESASNALTVKALGVQKGIKQSVVRSEQQSKDRALQTSALDSRKYRMYQAVRGVGAIVFLSLVGHQVLTGALAAPFFLTYYLYFMQVSGDAISFGDFVSDLTDVRAGIGRMMPIYWAKQEVEGTRSIAPTWKRLVLDKVSFSYPGSSAPALQNVSMSVERGQKVGIAGRSGEGKSTLVKLLLSVYRPDSGSIEIGGVPLQDVRTDERVHRISAVLQETELFSLSLRENITVFRGDDARRMEMAIKVAQLEELVAELPEGIETQIGEKGYKLSGGQRQRVGIARAVYARSDIIVMDEATSSLDSATEAAVQQGIEQELGGRTLVMIAHRLSTLQHADVIHFVAGGSIVESGTFDELIALPDGLFRQQYELQNRQGKNA
jgi:ABC-type multidrug transport system fused ATPase/permease subunit